jgi:hypothetical protein
MALEGLKRALFRLLTYRERSERLESLVAIALLAFAVLVVSGFLYLIVTAPPALYGTRPIFPSVTGQTIVEFVPRSPGLHPFVPGALPDPPDCDWEVRYEERSCGGCWDSAFRAGAPHGHLDARPEVRRLIDSDVRPEPVSLTRTVPLRPSTS